MAMAEDAASVLELWVQDVANLPAEMQHLLEEIEAKDKVVTECRKEIQQRDISIQKHLKASGMSSALPKESAYVKTALEQFDKAQAIQEEKVALSEKARVLLDRHIKRFDQQIKQLEQAGILPPDPLMPSLLHQSPGNRLPPLSATTTGSSTPLHPIAGNASHLPAAAITNTAIARLVSQQAQNPRGNSPVASAGAATPPATGGSGPTQAARHQRESSIDAKRRRLNAPATSSGLRQSSLGPSGSTPKASTPTGRAGSAGPRATGNKKKDGPTKSGLTPAAAGVGRLNPAVKKGSRRKGGRKKGTQSDTGEDSALSEVDGSESERASTKGEGASQRGRAMVGGVDGSTVVEDEDDEGADGDDKKYCTCRSVSYGNMVACDNEECEYEWFHWSCVGMTREPAGKWYCEDCKQKLGLK